MNEDTTVTIPQRPKPVSAAGLGALIALCATSWTVTAVALAGSGPSHDVTLNALLVASALFAIASIVYWAKYSAQNSAAKDHAALIRLLAGQHAMVMAELRAVRGVQEEHGGHLAAQLEALHAKVGDYFSAFADGVEVATGTEGKVTSIGRARVPRST